MEEKDQHQQQLLQIYDIERQSDQNSALVVFAIIAAGLTYIVASAGFLLGHYHTTGYKNIPSVVLLASPLVVVSLLSALVLTVSTNAIRVKHLKELEKRVDVQVKVEGDRTISLPSSISDSSFLWEFKGGREWPLWVYKALLVATYLPIFVLALGYTFAVLVPGPWSVAKLVAFIIYCLAIAAQAAGLLVPSFHPRFKKITS